MMVGPFRRNHEDSSRGYSLIEAIVVLAIIGVLVGASVPNLPRWIDKWRIDGAARQAALHIALAKLKAVSHRYPYTVTYVPPGGTYSGVVFSRYATLVIEGGEGNLDMNGNGVWGEGEDPLQDRRLVMAFPAKVQVNAAPAVPLPGNPGPTPITYLTNGLARMTGTSGAPLFGLYFTNVHADWKAVTAQHSGRIKVHSFNSSSNSWIED